MMTAIIHPDRKPCLDVYAHSSSSYFETSHFLFMGFNTSLKCWASSLGWEGQGLSLCCRGSPVKGIGRLFGQLRSVPPKIKCFSLSSPGRALSLYFFFKLIKVICAVCGETAYQETENHEPPLSL